MGHEGIDLINVAKQICNENGFSLVEKVGAGTYKQTFKIATAQNQRRALKIFHMGLSNKDRTNREIDAMRRCDHPNIAKLFEVGLTKYKGTEYSFVMEEYLGGGTLASRIEKTTLSSIDLLRLGQQLISGVSHIAKQSLVHRDLKPENILFRDDQNEAVITDFGLVRDLGKTSITGSWLVSGPGTPFYAAPEQLNNEKSQISWRTDQFCLGMVFAMCSFGEHPYGGPEYVAARSGPTMKFKTWVTDTGFVVIEKMLAAYTVRRYATPEILLKMWNEQEVGK